MWSKVGKGWVYMSWNRPPDCLEVIIFFLIILAIIAVVAAMV